MRKWIGALTGILMFCLIAIGIWNIEMVKTVSAVDDNPFYVTSNDFEVKGIWENEYNYKITLRYIGDNEDGLPQVEVYPYILPDVFLETDDADLIKLKKLVPLNNSKFELVLLFDKKTSEDVKGFTEVAPTKLIVPTGTEIGVSNMYTNNVGKYTSLVFTSALTLEKYTTDTNEESWRCVPIQTYERYDVDFDEEDTILGVFRNTDNCIYVQIKVPYTATANATYTGTAPVLLEGMSYSSPIEITQEKDSDILYVTLTNSENVLGSMGSVTLSVTEGNVVDEVSMIIYEFEGIKTFYGYADGTFTQEKKIEIRIQDGDDYTVITVNDYIESYPIPQVKGKKGHIFYKWIVDGEEYPENTALRLEDYKETGIDVFAEYIACGLVQGAWLRVGDSFEYSGIRFQSVITKEAFEKYKTNICGMGIIVMPTDLIESDKEFILQNYSGEKQALNFYATKNNIRCDEGTFTLNATVNNVRQTNYNRAYSARAYLVMNFGGINVYFWEDTILQRTPYDLANAVWYNMSSSLSTEQKAVVQAYAHCVLNIECVNTTATLIDRTGTQDAMLLSHSEVDGTVTVAIKTSMTEFPCVTYNGTRIKGSTTTYADGKLTIVFKVR